MIKGASAARIVNFLLLGLVAGAGCDNGDSKPDESDGARGAERSAFYEGYEADIRLLGKTYDLARPKLQASSPEACEAAARVFAKINFVGMTKDDVFSLLGSPAAISDYGIKAKPGPDEPLVYRFDTGWGGRQYTLQFREEKVVALKIDELD